MQITLEQARCFSALAESGNFQAAADKLHKSHSAVIYSIQCFEDQCGVPLLDRSEYRTRLTKAGQKIYQQCQELLASCRQLELTCLELSKGWEPSLSLIYDGVISPDPLFDILETFKSEKIPTNLHFFSDFLSGVEKTFLEMKADFMISVLPPKLGHYKSIQLPPVELLLVASRQHEIHRKRQLWDLPSLRNFNFFTVRGADRSLNLGTQDLEEMTTFHLADFSAKKAAINKGLGFGWLPRHLMSQEFKSGGLKLVPTEFPNQQFLNPKLYYPVSSGLGSSGKKLINLLRQ